MNIVFTYVIRLGEFGKAQLWGAISGSCLLRALPHDASWGSADSCVL